PITLPAGGSVSITISGTVSVTAVTGQLANTAIVTPTGPDCTTPGVTCGGGPTTPVNPGVGVAGIAVTLTVSPTAPTAGQPVTYTTTTGNAGPDTAPNVVVTLPVPAPVLNPVGTPAAGGTCLTRATTLADIALLDPASGPYTLAGYPLTVVCTYPELAPGASVVSTVTGTLAAGTPAGTILVAQVVALSDLFDPDLSNNRAVARSLGTLVPLVIVTPGPLANTGAETQGQLRLVLILLALGSLLVAAGSRRRANGMR
ncbi:MAG: conserved repeat domain protein, partial [Jatrophihabitantaceae bacterium]|nr:conserved repeat domain protein [Jatrophihabitantaceae bacterium]